MGWNNRKMVHEGAEHTMMKTCIQSFLKKENYDLFLRQQENKIEGTTISIDLGL